MKRGLLADRTLTGEIAGSGLELAIIGSSGDVSDFGLRAVVDGKSVVGCSQEALGAWRPLREKIGVGWWLKICVHRCPSSGVILPRSMRRRKTLSARQVETAKDAKSTKNRTLEGRNEGGHSSRSSLVSFAASCPSCTSWFQAFGSGRRLLCVTLRPLR